MRPWPGGGHTGSIRFNQEAGVRGRHGLYGSFCGKEPVRSVASSGLTSLNNFS